MKPIVVMNKQVSLTLRSHNECAFLQYGYQDGCDTFGNNYLQYQCDRQISRGWFELEELPRQTLPIKQLINMT